MVATHIDPNEEVGAGRGRPAPGLSSV